MLELLLDQIFPPSIYCICCNSAIDDTRMYSLCDSCMEKICWVGESTCSKCGKTLDQGWSHELCDDCRTRHHVFDRGYTCAQYNLYERAMIMDLKYRDKTYIGPVIGQIMADRMMVTAETWDITTWVPVSRHRLAERGYDQAEIIARSFTKAAGSKKPQPLLRRVKETTPMKDLSADERLANVSGAFTAIGNVDAGKDVLVIEVNRRLLIPKSERLKPLISRGFANRMASISESKASNNALFQKIA